MNNLVALLKPARHFDVNTYGILGIHPSVNIKGVQI